MPNLTGELREFVARRIVAYRFEKAILDAEEHSKKTADALYAALYPKAVVDWMKKAPKGFFLSTSEGITLAYQGRHERLVFSSERPVSHELRHGQLRATDHPALKEPIAACIEANAALYRLRKETRDAHNAVIAQMKQYRTVKQLLDGWPEIASFLPAAEQTSNALIVPPTKLNALLNLPPKTKP